MSTPRRPWPRCGAHAGQADAPGRTAEKRLKPSRRRQEVVYLEGRYGVSQRRALRATLLAEDDFEMRKLQEALSHTDPRLTARYSHVGSRATREAVERMGRILRLDEADEIREGYQQGYQPRPGA